jgi:serine phosphatase RsbU (regulator of sigma subunit)
MPRGLQKILQKMLQPVPEGRYQDVVDVITDVTTYKNSVALQKDKKTGDLVSEMAENLKKVQMTLVASSPPQWPEVEIGFAGHQGISLSGVYYDFFEIPEGLYGIIMGEAASSGAEGVIYTAVLRGMVRSLCRLTTKPIELVTILNDIVFRDSMNQVFALNYLSLDPKSSQLHSVSCGYGNLWLSKPEEVTLTNVSTNNGPLGSAQDAVFQDISMEWKIGHNLIFNTVSGIPEGVFERAVEDNRTLPPQKQVEAILRKLRTASIKLFQDRSISLVSLLRKA